MNTEKKKILIADDDIDQLFQLKLLLENWGYEVVQAESQREAETIIEKFRPTLAILDLMMENDDSGFVLSFKMKRKYPEVPIIIMTAVTSETGIAFHGEEQENYHWIKADRFLEKGIQPQELKREIQKLIQK